MSELAKKVAGTFVPDLRESLPKTLAWATEECRHGSLAGAVLDFCRSQPEPVDPGLVIVEGLTGSDLRCRVTCRCSDHESTSTFPVDVAFTLDPETLATARLD